MPRRVGLIVAGVAATGLLLTGCTDTVAGHAAGTNVSLSPSSTDFPSSGSSTTTTTAPPTPTPTHTSPPPAARLACPHVVDATARLAYDCIGTGMSRSRSAMWPVVFQRVVDTRWTLDEGSGPLIRAGGNAAVAAKLLTQEMLQLDYGDPAPTSRTVHDADVAVGSARGHLVQTLITINPTFRSKNNLHVKQEQLSLVVVPVGAGQFSAWYVSVPDLQKQLWPTVPKLLNTLRVI